MPHDYHATAFYPMIREFHDIDNTLARQIKWWSPQTEKDKLC